MNPSDELRTLGLLAGTMGSSAKIYHAGYVVPDIREAIATMRQALGVTFTEPMALPIEEIGSVHGRHRIQLEFAYSAAPMHFELVSSVPGTMWDFNSAERGHHIGVWSDDLHADAARLDALGMPRIWWGWTPRARWRTSVSTRRPTVSPSNWWTRWRARFIRTGFARWSRG